MHSIDINCDLGEGFGIYQVAPEEQIFPWISSANIACGFHAGDPQTMRRSVRLALQHQVAIGAHPGTPDLAGFGRRSMGLSNTEIEAALLYQIGALEAFCRAIGTSIRHVKPHGWLYNEAAGNRQVADVIASVIKSLNPSWILFGLAGSEMLEAARQKGLPHAAEAFIDRTYEADGSLSARNQPGSVITNPQAAAQQCLEIVLKSRVRTATGAEVRVVAGTLCVHGDNPGVLGILASVRDSLLKNSIEIRPFDISDS
jgi:UPF0271 protein